MMKSESEDKEFYKYDKDHRFAAMYPLLARQILEDYGAGRGNVLDIGTGNGALPIELSKITDMELTGLDLKEPVLDHVRENMRLHGVEADRIALVQGDVAGIPLPDESFDLIISRGSIPFWPDMAAAFAEIYRVLAPGGVFFVGCGFSRYQPLEEIRGMRPKWAGKDSDDPRNDWKKGTRIPDALDAAGIEHFRLIKDAYGVWIEVFKSAA